MFRMKLVLLLLVLVVAAGFLPARAEDPDPPPVVVVQRLDRLDARQARVEAKLDKLTDLLTAQVQDKVGPRQAPVPEAVPSYHLQVVPTVGQPVNYLPALSHPAPVPVQQFPTVFGAGPAGACGAAFGPLTDPGVQCGGTEAAPFVRGGGPARTILTGGPARRVLFRGLAGRAMSGGASSCGG